MPIQKLRCFHCECMMLVVFGEASMTFERLCPHCGVLNTFDESNHSEPKRPLSSEHFCWACTDRTRTLGAAAA